MTGTFKIKTWKKMEREFGLDENGDINTDNFAFLSEMEEQIPNDRIIKIEDSKWKDSYGTWNITPDIIETEVFDVRKMSVEKFLEMDLIKGCVEYYDNDLSCWHKYTNISFEIFVSDMELYETDYRYIPPVKPDPEPEVKIPDHKTIMTSVWEDDGGNQFRVFCYHHERGLYYIRDSYEALLKGHPASWFVDKKRVEFDDE